MVSDHIADVYIPLQSERIPKRNCLEVLSITTVAQIAGTSLRPVQCDQCHPTQAPPMLHSLRPGSAPSAPSCHLRRADRSGARGLARGPGVRGVLRRAPETPEHLLGPICLVRTGVHGSHHVGLAHAEQIHRREVTGQFALNCPSHCGSPSI